ncbi:hypothetical protein GA0115240_110817 [Streptomyces sp. DvalAA-14]|uniref:hypothetical protein n=1 Tax=unclassified Streptomyces TaxID=2593676 RepID=UPI00081B39FE|nr:MULTISPECIES: hypothetical protein [unclassified Streptomyces]MYS19618.1 hypothetical protein [Streptomyces sp. SID4948]SCD48836.1 hypothetical protein GA0115240_110817 [Streptomyces sp. DvalAA-14]
MEEIRPRLRALRAALFAALCVTLSSTSHVLMAHAPLPTAAVAAAFTAVFALAYLLGGRERGFWGIAGLMVPVELAVDTLFTSGQQACYGPSGGPVTGSWRTLHEAVVCRGGQFGGRLAGVPGGHAAQQMPSTVLPWLLLALHVSVGLLASWWLRRGEAALHRVVRSTATAAFRPLLFAVTAARGGFAAPARRVDPAAARTAAGAPPARPLLHTVVRRGPPVLVPV